MSNFLITLKAVGPMFLIMAAGIVVRNIGVLPAENTKVLNKLAFNLLFPCLIFENIYKSSVGDFDPSALIYGIAACFVTYAVATVMTMAAESSNRTRGAMIQAMCRSNFVVIGFPVITNIVGEDQMTLAAVFSAVMVPLTNMMAVIMLELFRGERVNLKKLLKQIFTNALTLAALLGLVFMFLPVPMPSVVSSAITSLSRAATPIGLLSLGASISLSSIKHTGKNLVICVITRLIFFPALVLGGAWLLEIRGIAFATILGVFSAAPPIASFTMAEQMGSDSELAGNCVIVSSAFAPFTLFGWIFLSIQMGIF